MCRGAKKGLIAGSFGCVSLMHVALLDDSGIFEFTRMDLFGVTFALCLCLCLCLCLLFISLLVAGTLV